MRILSLSDIHGDMDAYQLFLEKLEGHSFDVVIIAGDLGDIGEAKAIVSPLANFGKPIFYVMGNWDSFSYQDNVHEVTTHLHLTHRRIGEWVFLGYSGCAANLYRGNPSLADKYDEFEKNKRLYKRKYGSYELFCKSIAIKELQAYIDENQIDVDELVLVTHDRFYALPFTPFLYIFGHRHAPKHTFHKGINCVNTAAISMESMLSNTPLDTPGNFCIVDLEGMSCQVDFNEVPSPYVRVISGKVSAFQWLEKDGRRVQVAFKRRERFMGR